MAAVRMLESPVGVHGAELPGMEAGQTSAVACASPPERNAQTWPSQSSFFVTRAQ